MVKSYRNRQMQSEQAADTGRTFYFFPKEKPPVAIEADSVEEATEILEAKRNKKA